VVVAKEDEAEEEEEMPRSAGKKKRRPRRAKVRVPRERLEGARCIACNRAVSPATLAAFEEHERFCPSGSECWRHAASVNAANPDSLVDSAIELYGGMTASVVGVVAKPRIFRRWMPTAHVLRFDSGRQEQVVLSDGTRGQSFRFLLDDEVEHLSIARQLRLEAELAAAKRHAADLTRADRDKASAIVETTRELEYHTLCVVCLDGFKAVALVPCGHRTCAACAAKCRQCPVCRASVTGTLRVY